MIENGARRGAVAIALAGVSLFLSAVAVVFGVGGAVLGGDDDTRGGADRLPGDSAPEVASGAQVEAVAHVILPPGTVLLSAVYSNGLETRLCAKLRLPATALGDFVTAGKFTAALTPGLRAVDADDNVGGGNLWDPGSATKVSGLQEQDPASDGTRRRVMADLGAAHVVTIYLYAGRN